MAEGLLTMPDGATYLSQHAPFAGLDPVAIARIAERVEVESFGAGEVIFGQGETPPERVRMVVSGAVELVGDGRTLDLLGEGELFGHPSMLAGLPTGFGVQAHEDTLCFRLPTDLLVPLLTNPDGLRYVARSLLSRPRSGGILASDGSAGDPAHRAVVACIREPTVICEATATVRETAQRMTDQGASCAVIRLGEGEIGIFTDQDLRSRVAAVGLPLDAHVARAMTSPVYTVDPSLAAVDVMVEMIGRGIRHVPVVSARGELVGVVTDLDLVASHMRTPFLVRRAIAKAADVDELVAAARQLGPTVIALYEAQIAPTQLGETIATFAQALTRRALELLTADRGDLPPLVWFATGSVGRGEAFPSSDIDSVLSWEGAQAETGSLATDVLEVLRRCGLPLDDHAASAAHPLFARSAPAWSAAIQRWLDRPEDPRLLVVISLLADARPVFTRGVCSDPFSGLREGRRHPLFMAEMRRLALAHRPPTGFVRDFVVEHSGRRHGALDLKQAGFLPIVDLARYLALIAGASATSTIGRLRHAAQAGAIASDEAMTLEEAFKLFLELRVDQQISQLRDGQPPTDEINTADLNPLVRRYLREAFRAIARTQRKLPGQPLASASPVSSP